MLFFVDRKKNIIRRSGENIAAAEVEAALQAHEAVAQVAVLAVPDEIREEEVMACVVPMPGVTADAALAERLCDWCLERLAYFKAPGLGALRREPAHHRHAEGPEDPDLPPGRGSPPAARRRRPPDPQEARLIRRAEGPGPAPGMRWPRHAHALDMYAMAIPERSVLLGDLMRRRILVLDGAMGTMIQSRGLTAADFGGPRYEGCNEQLNLTRPDVVADIHAAYLEAGADLISTNTFGCAPYVLAEYGLAERCHDITLAAARICRAAVDRVDTTDRPRFAIGAMGPGTRTITVTANVTFEEVRDGYYRQARALIEGGVDALLLETCQDTLNVKAAAIGVRQAMTEAGVDLPLMVSGTIEPMGTMLAGQDVDALYASLEHLGLFSIGLNCATGPEFMTDHLRTLSDVATCFVSVYPNAGLPDEHGHYEETAESLAHKMRRFVEEGWVNVVGGCCGTTPDHIRALARLVAGRPPRVPGRGAARPR